MSDGSSKMNLPEELSGEGLEEIQKTNRTEIEARRDVELQRFEALEEAIDLAESVVSTWKAHEDYKSTKVEWEGRVKQARTKVEKAKVSLEETKETNELERERLDHLREASQPVIEMLSDLVEEIREAEPDERRELRDQAIQVAEKLTQLQ
jgi:hypothetical protein